MLNVIVIGVGTMGSSTCMHLARRGCRVLGLDQFDIPNQLAAHHGKSRMFRTSYYEHPDYVPMLRRSLEGWRSLEAASGTRVLHLTGGLYVGPESGELLRGCLSAARQHSLPHEVLSPRDLALRFPQVKVDPSWVGMLERDAGFVVPELAVESLASEARRAGAELRAKEPVVRWSADGDGVFVETGKAEYRADKLVICAGPWSQKVAMDLGVPLVISRQVLGWVEPLTAEHFQLGRLPCFAIQRDDASIYYGFPELPWTPGFKIAVHARGVEVDPDRVVREAGNLDEREWREGIRKHFPGADGSTMSQVVCMYDNSPDGHFILDRHPRHHNIVIGCGFSGHGFKFAPVIGEILSDLVVRGETALPAEFLRLKRFDQGLR